MPKAMISCSASAYDKHDYVSVMIEVHSMCLELLARTLVSKVLVDFVLQDARWYQ